MDRVAIRNHFFSLIDDILQSDYRDYMLYPEVEMRDEVFEGVRLCSGVSRCAIVDDNYDWVVKFDIDEHHYCEREIQLYNAAEREGIECCLPQCAYIGTYVDNCSGWEWDLYAYRKATHYESHSLNLHETSSLDRYSGSPLMERSPSMAFDLLCDWGDEIFYKLSRFCEANDINDLHNGNVGYICGHLVLIDFAGYNSNSYSDSYHSGSRS